MRLTLVNMPRLLQRPFSASLLSEQVLAAFDDFARRVCHALVVRLQQLLGNFQDALGLFRVLGTQRSFTQAQCPIE